MAKDCVEEILKAFKGTSRKEVEDIVSGMTNERKAAFESGLTDPNSQYRKRAMEILNQYRYDVAVTKAKKLLDVQKRQRLVREVTALGDTPEATAEGLSAKIVGSSKRVEGWSFSVDAVQHSNRERLFSGFFRDFDQAGDDLMKIARSGELDEKIAIERQQMNMKMGGKPGITGDQQAMAIAKIYNNLENAIYGLVNTSGAFKRRLDGFSGSVTHEADRLTEAGFDKWYSEILPLLDEKKTFESDFFRKDPKQFMETVYKDIINGTSSRKQAVDPSSDEVIRLVGMPSNFSKRMERARVLHFKDASAQYKYLKQYGANRNLFEEQIALMEKTARDAGLMRVFGSNPEATYQVVKKGLKLDEPKYKWLDHQMAEVLGHTMRPGDSPWAVAGGAVRTLTAMAKLGTATLSSFPDIAIKAHTMHAAGENYVSAWGKSFTKFLDAFVSSESRKEVAFLTGVGSEHLAGTNVAMLGAVDSRPGKLSRMQDFYYRANLLTQWTNAHKSSAASILSAGLGMRAQLSHEALPEAVSRNLSRYRIGKSEWEVIRRATEVGADGNAYVGFRKVLEMTDDELLPIMQKEGLIKGEPKGKALAKVIDDFRQETSVRLSTYFSDQSRIAQLEPGARERALLLRGTHADTPEGQALRFFAQFKMYPVAMATKAVPEIAFSNGAHSWSQTIMGGKSSKLALASMMGSLTALGYISLSAKAMLKNKTPPDPTKVDTMRDSILAGGGGGIYGDFILGEFDNRYGRNVLSAAAGPVIGQIPDIYELRNKLMDDKVKPNTKKAAAMRLVMNNLPGGNLPYVKAGIDYLFLYNLQESLNPGFQARTEARMKQNGQSKLFGP